MKVQVLYFDGCPHYSPTEDLVTETLRAQGIDAEVERVAVTTPEQAQSIEFLGSPTVRINGLDVEPEARIQKGYGFGCRTYLDDGKRTGLPSRQTIQRAIEEAMSDTFKIDVGQMQEPLLREDCSSDKHAMTTLALDIPENGSGSGVLLADGLSAILASTLLSWPFSFGISRLQWRLDWKPDSAGALPTLFLTWGCRRADRCCTPHLPPCPCVQAR
jgi:hypothetical protein